MERSKFLVYYCSCGGAFKVTAHNLVEKELAEQLFSTWKTQHTGPGHEPTNSNECNMVRSGRRK